MCSKKFGQFRPDWFDKNNWMEFNELPKAMLIAQVMSTVPIESILFDRHKFIVIWTHHSHTLKHYKPTIHLFDPMLFNPGFIIHSFMQELLMLFLSLFVITFCHFVCMLLFYNPRWCIMQK